MKPIIELRNVSKKIRNKQIIDNLSFKVMAGEVLGFLGPNGAGKTTTIRMITGLMKVSSGEIIINGTNLKQDFEKAISQIGAIVENPELYKFLTGYENLMQAARLYKGVTKEKINQVVEMVGLKDHIHNKVKTYSLGMRQRLGIALCLLHDPKVLILDEPTNGLDPAGIKERSVLTDCYDVVGIEILFAVDLLEFEYLIVIYAPATDGRCLAKLIEH